MSSVVRSLKQANGYFVLASSSSIVGYTYSTAPSGAGGSFAPGVLTQTTVYNSLTGSGQTTSFPVGTVLKDMGKTLLVGAVGASGSGNSVTAYVNGLGPRVFRKVQILNVMPHTQANGTVNLSNGVGSNLTGTDVGATAAGTNYNTFYIELPVSGDSTATPSNLIYVPNMPGFGF